MNFTDEIMIDDINEQANQVERQDSIDAIFGNIKSENSASKRDLNDINSQEYHKIPENNNRIEEMLSNLPNNPCNTVNIEDIGSVIPEEHKK